MKLTDTQLVLLSAASQRQDRGIELAANLKGGAAQKLVRKLLTDGLIEEVGAIGSLPVWRRGEDNQHLRCVSPIAGSPPSKSTSPERSHGPRNPAKPSNRPILLLPSFPAGSLLLFARRPGTRPHDDRPSPAGQVRSRPA
jgi:hypothetical protein